MHVGLADYAEWRITASGAIVETEERGFSALRVFHTFSVEIPHFPLQDSGGGSPSPRLGDGYLPGYRFWEVGCFSTDGGIENPIFGVRLADPPEYPHIFLRARRLILRLELVRSFPCLVSQSPSQDGQK